MSPTTLHALLAERPKFGMVAVRAREFSWSGRLRLVAFDLGCRARDEIGEHVSNRSLRIEPEPVLQDGLRREPVQARCHLLFKLVRHRRLIRRRSGKPINSLAS